MNSEIQFIWQEIIADMSTPAAWWQLFIIAAVVALSWAVNGALKAYLLKSASESVKPFLGGINRILFPITALLLVSVARYGFSEWMHVGMLRLASRLFMAMAIVRLVIYALRYIFSPSGWLKALEHMIAWIVWGLLALHLSGFLSQIVQVLEDVQFSIGKSSVNLLIVLQGIFTVVFTIFVALWLSRLLENKLMRAEQVSLNMRVVLVKLVRILFIFVAVLIALSAVGLDITLLSVFGGALGVGLGFGLQKIASNYVSGFIILLDKSMKIGDVVTVDKHFGVIQDLRSRYMVLGKQDGTNVIIPNEALITSAVINHSLHAHRGRVVLSMSVHYDSPLELVKSLVLQATQQHSRVLAMPSPVVNIRGFNEQGVELVLVVWVADPENAVGVLQSDIYMDIWKAFKANSIQLVKHEHKAD